MALEHRAHYPSVMAALHIPFALACLGLGGCGFVSVEANPRTDASVSDGGFDGNEANDAAQTPDVGRDAPSLDTGSSRDAGPDSVPDSGPGLDASLVDTGAGACAANIRSSCPDAARYGACHPEYEAYLIASYEYRPVLVIVVDRPRPVRLLINSYDDAQIIIDDVNDVVTAVVVHSYRAPPVPEDVVTYREGGTGSSTMLSSFETDGIAYVDCYDPNDVGCQNYGDFAGQFFGDVPVQIGGAIGCYDVEWVEIR